MLAYLLHRAITKKAGTVEHLSAFDSLLEEMKVSALLLVSLSACVLCT